MTPCTKRLDTDFNGERDAHQHEVVYVIRRATYEIVLSVPTVQGSINNEASALFHLRFLAPHQEHEVVLDLKALEDLYGSLSRLMEYVDSERLRSR
jgi:hypothetical protein